MALVFYSKTQISLKAISGKLNDINSKAVNTWKKRLLELCLGFTKRDIFNADKTGVFFKQLPTRTLAIKSEKCSGGKLAKERVTCLLACNIIGDKLRPLVIGKLKCLRAFLHARITTRDLPVMSKNITKAWMTSELFIDWLNLINRLMKAGNRHILLFVDNAPSHPFIELSNITLKFFPPNMTAAAQPLDQGIIQSFKLRYCRSLMDKLLANAEHCKSATDFTTSITVLDAIRWIRSAWDSVEFSTITKCFHRSGFVISEPTVLEGETPDPTVASLEDKIGRAHV